MSFNNLLSLEPDPISMKLTASRNEFEYSNQFKSRRNQNSKRIRRKNFDGFLQNAVQSDNYTTAPPNNKPNGRKCIRQRAKKC